MLEAGAKGYLPKESAHEELIQAIEVVAQGRSYLSPLIARTVIDDYIHGAGQSKTAQKSANLTPKETEVLQLIAEGKSSKEIASVLNVGVRTIETHRHQILKKLNLSGIAEITKYAIRHGLISIE